MHAIARGPIDVARIQEATASRARGAMVTFAGIVRDAADDGRAVAGLSYEAYEPLALKEFRAIEQEAAQRFGPCEVSIVHRVGELACGEVAVVACVAGVHRAQTFDACRYTIDEVKRRAPIWKSERYTDGTAAWKENEDRPRARIGPA